MATNQSSLTSGPAPFIGLVRPLDFKDLTALATILTAWIPSAEEILEDLRQMEASVDSPETLFLVAQEKGLVLGVAGLQPPSSSMRAFLKTASSAELIHFFVLPQAQRRGVGTALLTALLDATARRGLREIVFNSGPRYRDSAWSFYDHLTNFSRRGLIKDLYGPGRDAPVWGSL